MKHEIFTQNPNLKEVHLTSDGQAFYNDNDAKLHAKSLKDKKVELVLNPDYLDVNAEEVFTDEVSGDGSGDALPLIKETTDAPATDAPATDAPATDAPATDAPATDAPVTDAPATDAPTTDAPATDAPATVAPKAKKEAEKPVVAKKTTPNTKK